VKECDGAGVVPGKTWGVVSKGIRDVLGLPRDVWILVMMSSEGWDGDGGFVFGSVEVGCLGEVMLIGEGGGGGIWEGDDCSMVLFAMFELIPKREVKVGMFDGGVGRGTGVVGGFGGSCGGRSVVVVGNMGDWFWRDSRRACGMR